MKELDPGQEGSGNEEYNRQTQPEEGVECPLDLEGKKTQRKLIRRSRKLKLLRRKKHKERNCLNKITIEQKDNKKLAGQDDFSQQSPTQNKKCLGSQLEILQKKSITKIQFNPCLLPEKLYFSYQQKEKLKNTDLMLPNVKFVQNITQNSLNKWAKALIIYQQNYKSNERAHFGLILKYKCKLISFDGIQKLWPIQTAVKSYHWQKQKDTWSCGYRVYFWVTNILQVGLDKWVQEYEDYQNKINKVKINV